MHAMDPTTVFAGYLGQVEAALTAQLGGDAPPPEETLVIAARLGLDPDCTWTLSVMPLVAQSRLEQLVWGIDQLGVVRKGMQHVLVGGGPQLRRLWRRARVQQLAERLFVMPHCDLLPDLLGQVSYVWQSGATACGA